jgi:hypothetical protein
MTENKDLKMAMKHGSFDEPVAVNISSSVEIGKTN